MMADQVKQCDQNECSSTSCEGCEKKPTTFHEKTHEMNSIKRVIGVVSGKGGVGKSLVTAMLSVLMNRKGYKIGILDADITGPSIPKMFGVNQKADCSEYGIFPVETRDHMKVMSINLLVDQEDTPVIWRGPIIAGAVKQFWTDVIWGDLDFMFIDMPPGTGDVAITVFQSIPLDGIIIVTSPQDLVSLIVKKAYNMAKQMNIPVLGIVENMSYVSCPDCNKKIQLFGESKLQEIAQSMKLEILGRLPIDAALAALSDKGEFEKMTNNDLLSAIEAVEYLLK